MSRIIRLIIQKFSYRNITEKWLIIVNLFSVMFILLCFLLVETPYWDKKFRRFSKNKSKKKKRKYEFFSKKTLRFLNTSIFKPKYQGAWISLTKKLDKHIQFKSTVYQKSYIIDCLHVQLFIMIVWNASIRRNNVSCTTFKIIDTNFMKCFYKKEQCFVYYI